MTSWGPGTGDSPDWGTGPPAAPSTGGTGLGEWGTDTGPHRTGAGGHDDGWGTPPPHTPGDASGTSAPMLWLVAGVMAGVLAVVVGVIASTTVPAVVAWVLGGPVAIALLGVFIHHDTQRRADPWYAENPAAPWLQRSLVAVSLLAVALSALTIADQLSRR